MHVGRVQNFALSVGQPSRSSHTLAFWTMPVTAGVISASLMATGVTTGFVAAQGRRVAQLEVLDAPYEHTTFTLPQDLSPLVLYNPRPLYGLLFRTVSQSLLDIAGDPKPLGAEIGGMAILHTWGSKLQHHPHLPLRSGGGG